MKAFVKLSTSFFLAIGGLIPVAVPSLANAKQVCTVKSDTVTDCEILYEDGSAWVPTDVSPYPLNSTYNAKTQTICTDDVPGTNPLKPVTSDIIVCGPIVDFANGSPLVDTTGLPKLIDRSCESADCLRYKAHLIDKAERAQEKAQAKAERAQAKSDKARR